MIMAYFAKSAIIAAPRGVVKSAAGTADPAGKALDLSDAAALQLTLDPCLLARW